MLGAVEGRMYGNAPQTVKADWETASLNQQLEVLRSHLKISKFGTDL